MGETSGLFITLEGIEGAGKSTQARWLVAALERTGRSVCLTREPGGGGKVGDTLRALLKDPEVWRGLELAEIYLYAAARAQHLESVVLPALARGEVVVCDRYLDSTRTYQGDGRGRPHALIEALHAHPPLTLRPARTLLFDIEPRTGLERARGRGTEGGGAGYDDENVAFFERVRAGFLRIASEEPSRVRRLDAADTPERVHAAVVTALEDLIPGLAPLPEAP